MAESNANHLFSRIVFVGSGIWEWLGSGFLVRSFVARCQLGLQSSEGARVALPRGGPAATGCWPEASVLLHVGLSTCLLECFYGGVAGCPCNKQSRRPRWILQRLPDLTWEVT